MDLEDLRAAQTRERATDGLQDLRDSFYEEVADYIADLRDQREQAASATDDPFGSEEVQSLTDEIETAEQVVEAIYERRIGKLVKQASLAAAGVPDEKQGLTAEERDLYADIVDRIQDNKSHVLDVIAGEVEPEARPGQSEEAADRPTDDAPSVSQPDRPTTGDTTAADREPDGDASAAAAMGDGLAAEGPDAAEDDAAPQSRSEEPTGPPSDRLESQSDEFASAEGETAAADEDEEPIDRTTVRITEDVGEIFGVDERPYTLEAEDVVTLPEENAEPLVKREAAERLDE